MKKQPDKNIAKEPFAKYGSYTYADYLTWQMEELVELIRGKVFRQAAAAPRRIHEELTVISLRGFMSF